MKKVTAQQHRKLEALNKQVDMCITAIYHCGPNRNTPFSECLKLADEQTRKLYDKAVSDRHEFEHKLVSEGRGWFNQFGHFYSY